MRIRGLGESGRLGAAVLILATWMLACLALLAGWKYADAKERCLVSRETFTQAQLAVGHSASKLQVIPKGVIAAALRFNNERAPKPIVADDISFFLFVPDLQLVKIVFWKNGCYVDDGIINFEGLGQLMKSGGPEV